MKKIIVILIMMLLLTGCSDSFSEKSIDLNNEDEIQVCGDTIDLSEFVTDGDLDTDGLSEKIALMCRDYVIEDVNDAYKDRCNEDNWVDDNGNKVLPDYQEVVDCTLEDIFQDY